MCCHVTPSIFVWEGGREHHVATYPKIAGATYWRKVVGYNTINACDCALCLSFSSWQVVQTSSTVGLHIAYCWQTLFAFLVYLGCDLQSSGSDVACSSGPIEPWGCVCREGRSADLSWEAGNLAWKNRCF